MVVLITSLAPVLIIIFYVYFRDKYDREPVGLLLRAVLLGVVIVLPIILTERFLLSLMPPLGQAGEAFYHAFLVAGTSEELFKFLALYVLIWKSPSFNEKFDGIVYAVFISLGFAAVENVMYVLEGGPRTALLRALTAVPAHALFGITMGYYFGVAHMYSELKKEYVLKSLLIPILLHGVYDFLLMIQREWLLVAFVLYVVYLYLNGFKKMRILSESSIYKPLEKEQ